MEPQPQRARCWQRARRVALAISALAVSTLSGFGCTARATIHDADEPARAPRYSSPSTAEDDSAGRRTPRRMSEISKIRSLITVVRASDHRFRQAGEDCSGPEAARELERRLARTPSGVYTAHQFIDSIVAYRDEGSEQDVVHLAGSTKTLPARLWMRRELDRLEGIPRVKDDESGLVLASARTHETSILHALDVVTRSEHTFIAPARRNVRGKQKGKRKIYSGPEFASMLRKKWEMLGADIRDFDTFLDAIATTSFVSMAPYQVELTDGSEQPFHSWIRAQLDPTARPPRTHTL